MQYHRDKPAYAFNHDGGALWALSHTAMTEQDAADLLVRPLANSQVNVIDWCIGTTGEHNCRTRHNRLIAPSTEQFATIERIVKHYNASGLDILDIVIKHGHANGMKVFGCVRLNHCVDPSRLANSPGEVNFAHYGTLRKDFRLESFQKYLAEVFEDLLAKGVDGITLDFERKAPFFPPDTPQDEKFEATWRFLNRIRTLTSKPVAARVAFESQKGEAQGQQPLRWIAEGLIDIVIPATHNHEPDSLDWQFDEFVAAASSSSRGCRVWPQIWPTGETWVHEKAGWPPERIVERAGQIIRDGADGAYFFNFCCYDEHNQLLPSHYQKMFQSLGR